MQIPQTVKILYTLFMAILIPFYWMTYGPTNFLYFCDVALFLTLIGVWREDKLLISMAAVGILLPQFAWVIDFMVGLFGFSLLGVTDYMFKESIPLFARGLSLFHGWLPFLLIFLVLRLGYDKRAFLYWTVLAWGLLTVCYLWMPAPGDLLANPNAPVNINYVYGFNADSAQTWVGPNTWFFMLIVGMPVLLFYPCHLLLKRFALRPKPVEKSTQQSKLAGER